MAKNDNDFSFSGVLESFMKALGGDCAMAKNVAEAADIVKGALEENILIQYDVITGLYKIKSRDGDVLYGEKRAKSLFSLVIAECVRIRAGEAADARTRKMNKNEIENIWELVRDTNQFDSRRDELYALPAWDGVPRIDTFMEKYFDCNCDPALFRLFITSVIAKWDNPEIPVHYFFDFVGEAKGCLAGDVNINVYTKNGSAYRQHKVRIARLFDLAKTESSRFTVRSFDEATGEMGYSEAEVIYSGEKQCYLLTCEDGSSIECSGNHRFYTDRGWKNILQLEEGEEIYMNAKGPTNRHDKNYRSPAADAKEVYVKYHPVARFDAKKKAHRIAEHKAIWEANANGLSLEQYVDLLNHYDGRPLITIPKGYDVHHINGDHFDNDVNNLQVLSKEEHGRLHGAARKPKQYLARKVRVKSVVPTEVKKTYDLSCVVGEHTYVANEFITHNTGKTTLFSHLFGKRALDLKLSSRKEDLFVAAYDAGALVVLDDECNWIGKGFDQFSYDEFKSLVTTQRDTFSRKFQQPETHDRPFIIVRTSNEPRTVFSADERRQIIFNIGLSASECRHWEMSDYERDQLLAEARDWYINNDHKPYELTGEEREQTLAANVENYDTDTIEYQNILKFVRALKEDLAFRQQYQIRNAGEDEVYVTWSKYADWCTSQRTDYADARRYNRHIRFIALKYPDLLVYYDKKRLINGQSMRVARIVQKERNIDIPD